MAKRDKPILPRYVYWGGPGRWWGLGEAIYAVLHRQPVRSNIIPKPARRAMSLWGPNGWVELPLRKWRGLPPWSQDHGRPPWRRK